jgi:hypothetical protein
MAAVVLRVRTLSVTPAVSNVCILESDRLLLLVTYCELTTVEPFVILKMFIIAGALLKKLRK